MQVLNSSIRHLFAFAAIVFLLSPNQTTVAQSSAVKRLSENQVRDVVQRSIPFIENGGQKWIENKKCITCHQVPHMVWALNAADAKGISVDREGLEFANKWSSQWINLTNIKRREDATKTETLHDENDAIAALILGRANILGAKDDTKWISEYRKSLLESQQEDGTWNPRGQLPKQKRPAGETKEVSSMWAMLAIATGPKGLEPGAEPVVSGQLWLASETEGKSTEWWATRLLLERELGNEQKADQFRAKLIGKQNEDGGWGWLCDEKSDAFGTGIAVYALVRDGVESKDEAIMKAIQFLASTQNKDGSWSVSGTKEENRNRFAKTSNYWGTCWAAIGLMETISDRSSAAILDDGSKTSPVSNSD